MRHLIVLSGKAARASLVRLVAALLACALTLSPTLAQDAALPAEPATAPAPVSLDLLPPEIDTTLSHRALREDLTSQLLTYFRTIADANGVLSEAGLADARAVEAAQVRAKAIADYLRADLDGDGAVTRDELTRRNASRRENADPAAAARLQQQVDRTMAADADANGSISFDEMRVAAALSAPRRNNGFPWAAGFLAMDGDGDGQVTLREVRAGAQAIFAQFDTDGDGELSEAEQKAATLAAGEAELRRRLRQQVAGCAVPPVPDNVRFVLLGAARGLEVPTATLTGQDEMTAAGMVEIEAGAGKLWVVAAADGPMLWRLSGAVDRVDRLVVIPDMPDDRPAAAGVVGLPAEKVAFAGAGNCRIRDILQQKKAADSVNRLLAEMFGRVPDDTVAVQNFVRISLPGGNVFDKLAQGAPEDADLPLDVWQQSQGFGRVSIVDVDPAQVRATGKVETYAVLPGEAGIVQLMRAGSIVSRPRQSFRKPDGTPLQMQTIYRGNLFEIVKPIPRFPGGFSNRNPVTFVLAKDVPLPAGNPFPSCVLDGTTGLPLTASPICPAR